MVCSVIGQENSILLFVEHDGDVIVNCLQKNNGNIKSQKKVRKNNKPR